jgi:negative regulator of sigma E activity
MTDAHTEVLSAFCDGEAVDPDALAAALADPAGREVLVDFARLRAAVVSTAPMPASLARLRPSAIRRVHGWSGRAAVAAAAAVVFLLMTAWFAPRPWFTGGGRGNAPPSPSRVVRYEPGVDWHPITH